MGFRHQEQLLNQFGPELTALLAYLAVVCRLPRRVTLELPSEVLNIPLSLGSERMHGKKPAMQAQFCWAHFKRNILGVQELAKTSDAERLCRDALALHARLFRLWHRFRAGPGAKYGPLTRPQLIERSIPIQKKFFALAQHNLDRKDRDVRNLAAALFAHLPKFFAFVEREAVEPTNNSAERALRCAVQWRKTSFGSRSAAGEVAVSRLLTVTRTCRMHNRRPLAYLAAAIRSRRAGQPAPSLPEKRPAA